MKLLTDREAIQALNARIASLESALVELQAYGREHYDCEGCMVCGRVVSKTTEALSQPALAQAAEKWKRMESGLHYIRGTIMRMYGSRPEQPEVMRDFYDVADRAIDAGEVKRDG